MSEPSLNPNVAVNTIKTTVLARPQYSYILLPKDKKLGIIWRERKLIRQGEKRASKSNAEMLAALTKRLKAKS